MEKITGVGMIDADAAIQLVSPAGQSHQVISRNELSTHRQVDSGVWVAIDGSVYDITSFLEEHPGGADILLDEAGNDVTEDFLELHSEDAKELLPEYYVGKLSALEEPQAPRIVSTTKDEDRPILIRPDTWNTATLTMKSNVSHDASTFTLEWGENEDFKLPCGKHILLRHRDPSTGASILRSYTPVSIDSQTREISLLIKVYKKTGTKPGGKMTTAIDAMCLGSTLEFKGPVGKFEYLGLGKCLLPGRQFNVKRFVMISAGSGITPILQVLKAISENSDDTTQCIVLNSNRGEEDILCRDILDSMASQHNNKMRIVHTLSRPSPTWIGLRGRISRTILEAEVGSPNPDGGDVVLLCGPPAMEAATKEALVGMNWDLGDIIQF